MMLCLVKVASETRPMPVGFALTAEPPPGPKAHLDPVEIPVYPDPCSTREGTFDPETELIDNFRHSGWKTRRAAILRALHDTAARVARLGSFATCGSVYWVLRNKHDLETFKVVTAKCHDRLCTPCAVDRQTVIRRNIAARVLDQPHRFLTLTIRHTSEPLQVLINRLVTAFRKLRQRRLWRDRVNGGASFLEITYNPATNHWNPHLHCILEGRYIPRPALTELWLAITGDSRNVHISLIRTRKGTIDYVTKYATKPLPPTVFQRPLALREAVQALSNRRLVLTFGRWRHWRLLADPDDGDWEEFASVDALRLRAGDDDQLASRILAMIHTADPETGLFHVDLDLPPPED
jgi:hypothetical protein